MARNTFGWRSISPGYCDPSQKYKHVIILKNPSWRPSVLKIWLEWLGGISSTYHLKYSFKLIIIWVYKFFRPIKLIFVKKRQWIWYRMRWMASRAFGWHSSAFDDKRTSTLRNQVTMGKCEWWKPTIVKSHLVKAKHVTRANTWPWKNVHDGGQTS